MRDRALATGRPVNGFSAADLEIKAGEYAQLSRMTDLELERHFERAGTLVAARIAELRGGAR